METQSIDCMLCGHARVVTEEGKTLTPCACVENVGPPEKKISRPFKCLKDPPRNPIRAFRYEYCEDIEKFKDASPSQKELYRENLPAWVRMVTAADFALELGVTEMTLLKAEQEMLTFPTGEFLARLYHVIGKVEFNKVMKYYANKVSGQWHVRRSRKNSKYKEV